MEEPIMIKVFISPLMLDYQQEIADLTRQCIQSRYIAGVKEMVWTDEEPALAQVDLLPPPRIETIHLMNYEGHAGDLILLGISTDFGVGNLHISIRDDQGNIVENGDGFEEPLGSGIWNYFATREVPSGTTVTVYAAATDSLGGVGTLSDSITIP
jgi:hypothetical protein